MFKDERDSRLGQRGGEFSRQQDPTLMQVLAAAAVIRMGWSEAERRSRWMFSEYRWQAPHCPADLREMLNGSG
jgi:hypothetical protein